jgi:hypothetical protein
VRLRAATGSNDLQGTLPPPLFLSSDWLGGLGKPPTKTPGCTLVTPAGQSLVVEAWDRPSPAVIAGCALDSQELVQLGIINSIATPPPKAAKYTR